MFLPGKKKHSRQSQQTGKKYLQLIWQRANFPYSELPWISKKNGQKEKQTRKENICLLNIWNGAHSTQDNCKLNYLDIPFFSYQIDKDHKAW